MTGGMRLTVNGAPAAPELARRTQAIADAMAAGPAPRRYSPEHSALHLRGCRTETEFLRVFLELAGRLAMIDASPAPVPSGFLSAPIARFRRVVWRWLGNPLDRVVARQNRATAIVLDAVRFCAAAVSSAPTSADAPEPPPDAQG